MNSLARSFFIFGWVLSSICSSVYADNGFTGTGSITGGGGIWDMGVPAFGTTIDNTAGLARWNIGTGGTPGDFTYDSNVVTTLDLSDGEEDVYGLVIGNGNGAPGRFTLSDGELRIIEALESVGGDNAVVVVGNPDSDGESDGTLILNGGDLTIMSSEGGLTELTLGFRGNADQQSVLTIGNGSTLSVLEIEQTHDGQDGNSSGIHGTLNLNNGTIVGGRITNNDTDGMLTVNVNGGIFKVENITSNGGDIVGGPTNNLLAATIAVFDIAAGGFTIETNGNELGVNASMSGAGGITINGSGGGVYLGNGANNASTYLGNTNVTGSAGLFFGNDYSIASNVFLGPDTTVGAVEKIVAGAAPFQLKEVPASGIVNGNMTIDGKMRVIYDSNSELLACYQFDNQSLADSADAANITVSDLNLNQYPNLFDFGAGDFLRLSGPDTANDTVEAIESMKYLSFTVTVVPGFVMDLDAFQVDYNRSSQQLALISRARLFSDATAWPPEDFVSATIGMFGAGTFGNDPAFVTDLIDLNLGDAATGANFDSADFDGITGSMTFYIPWIDDSSSNFQWTDVDNIKLFGTVTPIPGPSADPAVSFLDINGNLDISSATADFANVSPNGAPLTDPMHVIAEYDSLTGSEFATVQNLPSGYSIDYAFGGNQIVLINHRISGFVTADSVQIFRGRHIGGTFADTLSSNNSRMKFNPGFILNSQERPVWLIFGTNVGTNTSSIEAIFESQGGTPGLTCVIEFGNAKNYILWDTVGRLDESYNIDTVHTFPGIVADHISSTGEVRCRIGWFKTGFTLNYPWEIRLDQFGWNVE